MVLCVCLSSSKSTVHEECLQLVTAFGGDVGMVEPAQQIHSEYVPVVLPHHITHHTLLDTHVLTVHSKQISKMST